MDVFAFKAYQDCLLVLISHLREKVLVMAKTKQRQAIEGDIDELEKIVGDQSKLVEYVLTERGRH